MDNQVHLAGSQNKIMHHILESSRRLGGMDFFSWLLRSISGHICYEQEQTTLKYSTVLACFRFVNQAIYGIIQLVSGFLPRIISSIATAMRHSNTRKHHSSLNTPAQPMASCRKVSGFALVATVSMMVLLVVIALGMLSLTSVAIRTESLQSHQEQAEANARMAAMIALGELQSMLGPDQRLSATADILGNSVHANRRNWTVAWNTEGWDPKEPVTSRNRGFMGALVSGASTQGGDLSSALAEFSANFDPSDPSWAELVGEGTVPNFQDHVYARKVEVPAGPGTNAGSYAFWVGDEGVKARVNVSPQPDNAFASWASASAMTTAPGLGIHKVAGLDEFTAYLPGGARERDIDKFISRRSLDLGVMDRDALRENYHHLTTQHTGLVVDNRLGGIRRDLSTAFEISPEEFASLEEFNNSGESNQTEEYASFVPSDVTTNPLYYHNATDRELGYLYEVPVDSNQRFRGPTWDLLRNHYRIYKKERNGLNFRGLRAPQDGALAAHGVVPFSYTGNPGSFTGSSYGAVYAGPNYGGAYSFQCPFVSPHGVAGGHSPRQGNYMQPTVQKITPELIRTVVVFGLARENDHHLFTATPYFTFHNPYNHPIEFYSLGVDVRGLGNNLDFFASYTDISGQQVSNRRMDYQGGDFFAIKTLLSFRLEAPTGSYYRLEPGEIRLMSMKPNAQAIEATENAIRFMEFKYNEENGVVKDLDLNGNEVLTNRFEVQPNSQISIYPRIKNPLTLGSLLVRLYHPEKATGGAYQLDDMSNFSNNNFRRTTRIDDTEPVTLIKNMKVMPRPRRYNSPNEIRTFNENQLTRPEDGFLALFAMDMRMKTFQDDVAVLSDFNYRSMGVCPRDYDSSDDLAPNWNFDLRPIGDYSELQLTDDINATAYWGTSHEAGSGQSKLVLFDLPRAPSVSLASLQHADTSVLNFHPMRSIGHSRAQVGQEDLTQIHNQLARTRGNTPTKRQIDTSWASNEAL